MKIKTLLVIATMTALCTAGGGMAGVSAMNWKLKQGDRVHISIVWASAVAGSLAPLVGYGAGMLWMKRRSDRQLDELETAVHDELDQGLLSADQQAPLILALRRIRARGRRGAGN